MYRFLFDDNSTIEINNLEALKIGMASYNGHDEPKYVYLWIKHRKLESCKELFRKWEDKFFYRQLKTIFIYDDEGKFSGAIPIPEPFLDLHYEEGDLVITYGDQLYADDAY